LKVKTVVTALLLAMTLVSVSYCADVKSHLVGVQHSSVTLSFPVKVRQISGSGICIDQKCSIIATAYHIQKFAGGAALQAASEHTDKVLSLARNSDPDKSDLPMGNLKATLLYNISNDMSFIYTKNPVPHKSGATCSYRSNIGQTVIVAGFYKNKFESKVAHLIGVDLPLTIGKTPLSEDLVLDIAVKSGTSGSGVFDEQGNLLGMIVFSGVIKQKGGDVTSSIALPVRSIATALATLDPERAHAVFGDIPKAVLQPSPLAYVLYQESDLPEDTSLVIPELTAVVSDVPNPVARLQSQADSASKLMVNFITKECLVQGTQKSICHELSIDNGQQSYRKIGKNGKLGKPAELFPTQSHGIWTQSDWADTLGEIADNPWVFQGVVDDGYLFSFASTAENDRCYYEEHSQGTPLFGGGHPEWKGSVVCFEQVLTDKDFNVLAVFTDMRPPDACLTRILQTATYYEWISVAGIKTPVLLPVRERMSARMVGQKDLLYSGLAWSGYQKFRSDHKIAF
jgi:hypothetical protein